MGMRVKGLLAAALALGLAPMLGSCTSFSGYVSDNWPHFAGGEPKDLPPRPGAPGYAAFIAHGQPIPDADQPTGGVPAALPVQNSALTAPAPAATPVQNTAIGAPGPAAQIEAPDNPVSPDASVVQGGLY